ncbi:hypothetical protein DPMN_179263 [Dreissena polymorpha]|uniref:Uncharacterized protein n=1 Tax=Dreissena polymorpha TaxID=45954 RepID=A0A9D4IKL9_DREPO|nr:hypothetical protein DPMN_179263 [Dreissena polymorpha]
MSSSELCLHSLRRPSWILRTCRLGSICLSWSFDHRSGRPGAESTKEDQRSFGIIPVRASTKNGRVFWIIELKRCYSLDDRQNS